MTYPIFELWAQQETGSTFTDPGELKMKTNQFAKKVRRRNLREYVAGILAIGIFMPATLFFAHIGDHIMALGTGLAVIGITFVLAMLYFFGSMEEPWPEDDCRSHLRGQLVRQRKALHGIPLWYLAPLAPGAIIVMFAGVSKQAASAGWQVAIMDSLVSILFFLAVFGAAWWLNWRAVRQLDRQIAEIDELA
ncbi:hypothetical protein [Altererythrobacter sp. MF3-039]|uniref:hypothetical protein n=1 Tax=Altererythrobacter sp. MF3-039 TaxID=3252901 RepID=UPI00390C40FE